MAYNYTKPINRPAKGAGNGTANVGNFIADKANSGVTLTESRVGYKNGTGAGLQAYGDGIDQTPTSGGVLRKDVVDEYLMRFITRKNVFSAMGDSRNLASNSGKSLSMRILYPVLHDLNVGGGGTNQAGGVIADGNLFGSSVDMAKAGGWDVRLDEGGKRQNQVSFKTANIEGSIYRNGIFAEATTDVFSFHDIKNLPMKEWEEMIIAANQIVEFHLQHFLLTNAGIKHWAGSGTSFDTMKGIGFKKDTNSIPEHASGAVTHKMIQQLSADLDYNQTPKDTTMLYGSTAQDTITLPRTRFAFIDPALIPTLEYMKDRNGNPAWRPVEKFGYGSEITRNAARFESSGVLEGVVGSIGSLTFIAVPRMLRWEKGGAEVSDQSIGDGAQSITGGKGSSKAVSKKELRNLYENTLVSGTGDSGIYKYDVYPILTVGSGSFLTINWTDKQSYRGGETRGNLLIGEKKPEMTSDDPFASRWMKSVQWWEGFMAHRPERIGIIHTLLEK